MLMKKKKVTLSLRAAAMAPMYNGPSESVSGPVLSGECCVPASRRYTGLRACHPSLLAPWRRRAHSRKRQMECHHTEGQVQGGEGGRLRVQHLGSIWGRQHRKHEQTYVLPRDSGHGAGLEGYRKQLGSRERARPASASHCPGSSAVYHNPGPRP